MQSKSSDNRHGAIITPNLRIFTYAELSAIGNFIPDTLLGRGVFGRVFKGWVDRETLASSKPGVGMPIAIKEGESWQALREWQAEVEFWGKLRHPNLVTLLGYCTEDKRRFLVYEYMEKGSLETYLFGEGGDPIPWDTRLNIATGAARGLTFLHTMKNQVIYHFVNASNILLHGDFNAKLASFGLAKWGPAEGGTHRLGTFGYRAHEYVASGHLSVKSDVYSFGVVLLELLTGLRMVDLNRTKGAHNLIDWAKPSLVNKRELTRIMDPRLENQYPPKAAFKAAAVVLNCLESDPRSRPPMEDVLVALEYINSIKINPKESKASEKYPARGPSPQP